MAHKGSAMLGTPEFEDDLECASSHAENKKQNGGIGRIVILAGVLIGAVVICAIGTLPGFLLFRLSPTSDLQFRRLQNVQTVWAKPFTIDTSDGLSSPYSVEKEVVLINSKRSYTTIEANEDEVVDVTVNNNLLSQGTTVHFHGMYQAHTAWVDGVDGITQCPIPPGASMTYRFMAYPYGTHWWHSHDGLQYGDGLRGPLIVYPKSWKGVPPLPERVLMISDWYQESGVKTYSTLLAKKPMPGPMGGDAKDGWGDISDETWGGILVNNEPLVQLTGDLVGKAQVGANIANMLSGFPVGTTSVRLRFICATASQMLVISVPGCNLTVVAVDGRNIEPMSVDKIQCAAGDRIDAILKVSELAANASVWLQVSAVNGMQTAVAAKQTLTAAASNALLNSVKPFWSKSGICDSSPATFDNTCISVMYARGLKPSVDATPLPSGEPNRKVTIGFGGNMAPYSWFLNDIKFVFPFPSLMNSGGKAAKPITLTGEVSPLKKGTQIIDIAVGELVDIVLDNSKTGMYHPFHLHGNGFWVIATGEGAPPAFTPTVPERPIEKDNQNVPAKGWSWLRFKADNPGFWIFHCHIEFHLAAGMDIVLRVGTPEQIDEWSKVPGGYLKCPQMTSKTNGTSP